ncbi:SusC/RagA family TonB-linked outer membrane protein [Pseudobacter ginsenosidimutans]|uniref:TonB-linked SusC/RagA family outer membrane protein n=1 Tax=Pseudobacter ginsenosidimutans TaxID=661488 RepID=A0A4Q7MNU2_9BACT|nr:SusC/RagA family TonB-linked outer membrane protein [Pseudobacter ginsenosidimutans]RZS69363.1 TonB-linked SusC/RagA family outer membrane protein [Pseudobacter ginsenosidimutans]
MRLTAILLTIASLHASAGGFSQITLSVKNAPLEKVFREITRQAGYNFVYGSDVLKKTEKVDLSVHDATIETVLSIIFNHQPLTYSVIDKVVVIKIKALPSPVIGEELLLFQKLQFKVVDSAGVPVTSATFLLKGSNIKGSTDNDGGFTLSSIKEGETLVITSVGFLPLTLTGAQLLNAPIGKMAFTNNGSFIKSSATAFTFYMKQEVKDLDEVVVSTGMFDRRKETFTGVTKKYSGKEIRTASRQNILEALNLLDPSLKIIRNNNLGSDPNQLPKIEMRGSRTPPPPTPGQYSQQLKLQYENDPNRPLFILDGFETNLQSIMSLDINRIASVTLLKDAASTALYGSRSANGVVVVETIRPTSGDLTISYTATGTVTMPDLSGYNMMTAEELLKFQELASVGVDAPGPFGVFENEANLLLVKQKHAYRKNAILDGVNSNWMKVPLQTAGTLNHHLSVTGGDGFFNYTLGLSKNGNTGVMKGSENNTNSGYANLNYRKGKITVSNNLTIRGDKREGSPYGSFTNFVRIPPYYRINYAARFLEDQHTEHFVQNNFMAKMSYRFNNPLYNALLPHKNTAISNMITNNLMLHWDLLPFLRVSGGFQYAKTSDQTDFFLSPLHTQFNDVEALQKGSYEQSNAASENYNGFLTLTYNKVIGGKHILTSNLRGDIAKNATSIQSISAVGFATTAEPLLYLANSYSIDGRPQGSATRQNSIGVTASLSYSYDMRYNLDLSYKLSGASNFGSDNPYQSFYSMGAGWNLGRENFMQDVRWIDHLNISANFGLTGNENAGNFGSKSTYKLNNAPSYFGESIQLMSFGNPNLDWTKTYSLSYSLSGRFLNNMLSLTLAGFRNFTDPMIITMPLPLSVGLTDGIPKNIGKLTTTGLDFQFDARLINKKDWTLTVGINAPLFYKSVYSGLGDALSKFNDSARKGGYAQRYYDGASPDDLYAVRSLGIGQGMGMEVFLDKDGNYTYLFDKNNEVVVGSSRPVSQGNINMRLRYRRFTLSVYTRYVLQEMKFNSALYNKVENITPEKMEFNQDRRALYVRWQKPGDDASFLGITQQSLGMSSRFLQKENTLYVEGINFNYDLLDQYSQGLKDRIRKKLGMRSLNMGITTSNIFQFQLSNIKLERGIDYPFQRSVTVNLSITF